MIQRLAVALIFFLVAFDRGAYGVQTRNVLAIAVWWAVILVLITGLGPRSPIPRASMVAGSLLAALGALTVASMAWAASAEKAFTEFNRVAFYLGLFTVLILLSTRAALRVWSDGIAAAVVAIGVLALTSRLFPDFFPAGEIPRFLPSAQTRLSYPVGYWNGLAILMALGSPLLLRVAAVSARAWIRGLAVGSLPALAAVVYLASSRGAVAAALLGTCVFLALSSFRWVAVLAIGVAALGSVGTIGVLVRRVELVNGPLESHAAIVQGRSAALLIVLICLATGLLYAAASRLVPRSFKPRPIVGRVATAAIIVTLLAGIAASNPAKRIEAFKEPPGEALGAERDFVKAHLLSGSGSGRWQFWSSAVDQFADRPFVGGGAGSYEAWWAEHRNIPLFVKDAHSLYVETMAELGLAGLVLVGAVFAFAFATLATRVLGMSGEERATAAAVGGGLAAYAVGAGIDWMWELTVVSAVGITFLALATGPATVRFDREAESGLRSREVFGDRGKTGKLFGGVVLGVVSWLLICAQVIPLLAQLKISESQAAIEHGDIDEALREASAARNLQPWAASPYVQLALVQERAGNMTAARSSLEDALGRDSRDWRLWLVAARLDTKLGLISRARESIRRAIELNPRSPLFADLQTTPDALPPGTEGSILGPDPRRGGFE